MNLSTLGQSLQEIVTYELFAIAGTPVTLASIGSFLLIVMAAFWISRALQRVLVRALTRGGVQEAGTVSTMRQLLHYFVMVVGIAIALQTVGISLATLFAAGAFVAVGIGFALQNILQNFVSGIILLGERTITERDVVEVEGQVLRVERIGARSTVARSRDDYQLIIPNSTLVQSMVVNYTLSDDMYRVRANVGVAYSSDMKRVEEALLRAGRSVAERVEAREPVALLLEFGDSSVNWEVSIWAADPWQARQTKSALNKAIWNELAAAGITIAFPQLDVHLNPAP